MFRSWVLVCWIFSQMIIRFGCGVAWKAPFLSWVINSGAPHYITCLCSSHFLVLLTQISQMDLLSDIASDVGHPFTHDDIFAVWRMCDLTIKLFNQVVECDLNERDLCLRQQRLHKGCCPWEGTTTQTLTSSSTCCQRSSMIFGRVASILRQPPKV